ncbi:hypothetical protein MES5069_160034 [Mesorhizobium escarrei]|uniref:DUF736 domain-containing protein n=1 Tax=Mesorhizobium escarrei TaxID=666018 RepID=A0ABN8JFZ1_9HYPH|nr:hypothetical protein MES5069_160034 [Mesorhizobium escarrei]
MSGSDHRAIARGRRRCKGSRGLLQAGTPPTRQTRPGRGPAEIGAAWSKTSNEGRDYLGLKLDDPSFNAPIYANLFNDEEGEGFSLIWSPP